MASRRTRSDPANTAPRMKGTRIERPFIIGSEAWPLDDANRKPDTPAEHTKGWRVYVRVPEGQPDITRWLKKVQFKIYHTYTNPARLVDTPPFQIEETGWGGFNVEVRLFFNPESLLKPEYRQHFLQLERYGDEAQQAAQERDRMVRSEFLEYAEFNEPTEAFYEALTDEAQWPSGRKGKGKGGRGKKAEDAAKGEDAAAGAEREGTVQLPEVGTPAQPFSRQLEQQIMSMLARVEKEVDKELEATAKERREIAERLKELKNG